MKTVWTKGLNDERIKELRSDFLSSHYLRERLTEICNDKIKSLRTEVTSKDKYGSPAWPYVQADSIGYERALGEIISLIENEMSKK